MMVTMINDGKNDGKMMINYDKSIFLPLIFKVTNCVVAFSEHVDEKTTKGKAQYTEYNKIWFLCHGWVVYPDMCFLFGNGLFQNPWAFTT